MIGWVSKTEWDAWRLHDPTWHGIHVYRSVAAAKALHLGGEAIMGWKNDDFFEIELSAP